jgi:hypothetical protein
MTILRALTPAEIERLASRKGIKRADVENFLSSMDGMESSDAYANAAADAHSYRWNSATFRALQAGIQLASSADCSPPER